MHLSGTAAARSARPGTILLKDQNRPALVGVLALNLVVFVLLMQTGQLTAPDIDAFVRHWRSLLPAGFGVALAGAVNGLLSAETKARLVFWRWSNPLPGSFAFSRYAQRDARIDIAALRRIVGDWPADPGQQNAVWYRLYKSIEREPAVMDAHRSFLLTRDYTAIACLMFIVAGSLGLWLLPSAVTATTYIGLLLVQYLLARMAASNYGVRLVTTVLALKAAGS
jgi:hypothetical protein